MRNQSANAAEDPGLWRRPASGRTDGPRRALFLDRDGVIVEEVNYLHRLEDMRFTPRAEAAIALAGRSGLAVVIVTNQAGVGRGYYGWDEFAAVQDAIAAAVAAAGGRIDGVYACGYHAEGRGALARADHPWRKPNPGMILAAAEDLGIDIGRSLIVGDRASDLMAGRAAGLPAGFLVGTGYGGDRAEKAAAEALACPTFRVGRLPTLGALSAADLGA